MPTFLSHRLPAPKPEEDGWSIDGHTAFYFRFQNDFTPTFAVNLAGITLTEGIKKILVEAFAAGAASGEEIGKERARKKIREAIGL